MPTLRQLQDTTTPISLKRGTVQFTLHAALEKLSDEKEGSEGVTYSQLERQEIENRVERKRIQAQFNEKVTALTDAADPDALRAHVIASRVSEAPPKPGRKSAPVEISAAELQTAFDSRVGEIQREIEDIEGQLKANDMARVSNLAMRLAFLIAESDIVDEEGKAMLRGGVQKSREDLEHDTRVFESFSEPLLRGCLKEVEGAVYGPLVTTGSSAS